MKLSVKILIELVLLSENRWFTGTTKTATGFGSPKKLAWETSRPVKDHVLPYGLFLARMYSSFKLKTKDSVNRESYLKHAACLAIFLFIIPKKEAELKGPKYIDYSFSNTK